MPSSAIPFLILVSAGFGSFALVLSTVTLWAHAKDAKSKT